MTQYRTLNKPWLMMLPFERGLLIGAIVPCVLYYGLQRIRRRPKSISHSISSRGSNILRGDNSPYYLGWKHFEENPYHPVTNPDGCIQLGLAESKLGLDLLDQWIQEHPNELRLDLDKVAGYPDYAGTHSFRSEVAGLMQEILGVEKDLLNPENVVITSGASAAIDVITYCIAEPGSSILVPSPYYPGFGRDIAWRNDVKLVPVPCYSTNNFIPTKASLQHAFSQHNNIRALLISSPCNPVGNTFDAHTLRMLLEFVQEKGIHLICDEIYAGSVFKPPSFVSIIQILHSGIIGKTGNTGNTGSTGCTGITGRADITGITDSSGTTGSTGVTGTCTGAAVMEKVHVIYGLSKDFGIAGFRVGVLFSWNKEVVSVARKLGRFSSVSTQTQSLLTAMLKDKKFVGEYVREHKRRLKKRHEWVVGMLKESGISCIEGNAGFFCWINLRDIMLVVGKEEKVAEIQVWKKLVYELGINLTPSCACDSGEFGWFRLCFASASEEVLSVAFNRLKKLTIQSQK